MANFASLRSGTAFLSALAVISGAAAPIVMQAPAYAQSASFYDVSDNYWARDFIRELASRRVLGGFPDGSFRPDEPVTRAQFAAMLRQAFNRASVRNPVRFTDVPTDYWAAAAINEAYIDGWMSGFPEGDFRPEQNISRAQVIVALSNGLGYTPAAAVNTTLQVYNDVTAIPDWARNSIAAATEKRMVVNYPSTQALNPNRTATRAEVAALLYQALVSTGQVAGINSPYIVGQTSSTNTAVQIPEGTSIPTRYDGARKILLSFKEPDPVPVTLTVDRSIVTQSGRVLIPADSKIEGELRVIDSEGAQFYSKDLILPDGSRVALDASSQLVTTTETVRRGANAIEILAGTAVGAAAAAGVSAVTGDQNITVEEVLSGAGLGTLAGLFLGRNQVELISINPDTDLDLQLNEALVIR